MTLPFMLNFDIMPLLQFASTVKVEQKIDRHKGCKRPFKEVSACRMLHLDQNIRISANIARQISPESEGHHVTEDRSSYSDENEINPEESTSPSGMLSVFVGHVQRENYAEQNMDSELNSIGGPISCFDCSVQVPNRACYLKCTDEPDSSFKTEAAAA